MLEILFPVDVGETNEWVVNSASPDQTQRSIVSDLNPHCLLRPVRPKTYAKFKRCIFEIFEQVYNTLPVDFSKTAKSTIFRRMPNSVALYQELHSVVSDLGLHGLLRPAFPST